MASSSMRTRHSRSTGEKAIHPKPSPAYSRKKAALEDDDVRLSLDLVEEAIGVDPDSLYKRIEIDGIVYDRSEQGIMVAYTIEDGEPLLLTFTDLWDR